MGRGPDRQPRRSGAQCAICGIWAGNSRGTPVHRYRLARTRYDSHGKPHTSAIASLGMCDTCIREKGGPVRDYSNRRLTLRHKHPRLTASRWPIEGTHEWHMHADYRPQHEHPELGPDEGE